MGIQGGFGNNIKIRTGTCYCPDKGIKEFSYQVSPDSDETWGEGLIMFHNPNAKFKIRHDEFPSIAHCFYDNGEIKELIPDFFPYCSIDIKINPF
jgi:hypothetical protein